MEDISKWTVKQLKEELRRRGAPLNGKKADLVERLTAYDINNNFRVELALEPVLPDFFVPPEESFKDINANTQLPGITRLHVDLFFKMYNKKSDMAHAMYTSNFLEFVRHCELQNMHFFKGVVHAQMYKKVSYTVYVKVASDGRVEGSHCECAAGAGGSAHCKHVGVVLLGIVQMVMEGHIITRKACTQQLQSFHRPKKTYQGTPLKSSAMRHHTRELPIQFDPRPIQFRSTSSAVNVRLHNLCAPFKSTMPWKHTLPPANPYAVEWDHVYSKSHPRLQFLKSVYLLNVSDEDISRIERETRGQSGNPSWFEYRKYRITASHFKECCCVQSEDAARSLCKRLLNPSKVSTEAMQHGIINEPVAVKQFLSRFDGAMTAEECGLFLMKDRPYLGASPDRKLAEVTLLEVKCPFTSRDRFINPATVPYLYVDDAGNLRLKPTHEYMYQIQGQLAATNRDFCDFIVYTYCDLKVISIPKDVEFINAMLQKLDIFYEKFFLPQLLDKYYYRYYDQYSFV